MQAKVKSIDWEEALSQVGGDQNFLFEVLNDLLTETRTAEDDIARSLNINDFSGILRACHKIIGSASYLSCVNLKGVTVKLQEAAYAGANHPPNPEEILNNSRELFKQFRAAVVDLRTEISLRNH